MNGYERIKAALELREPDRIPVMEWLIAPNVMRGVFPECRDEFEFVELMDLDGIDVGMPAELGHAQSMPDRYVDLWGVVQARTAEAYAPIEGPIKSEADLEAYRPPDPHKQELYADVRKAVSRFKGERFIFFHTRAEFMRACELRGISNFLMDLVINPDLAHGVLKVVNDCCCAMALEAVEAGADAILLGDDWAFNTGPFMSPESFRKFILPYFERMVRKCKEAGAYVVKHSDGDIRPLLDMVVGAGIDGINPIEPVAGMNLGEVKEEYGKRVCVLGNIDCGYTLSEAPVSQVVREVKEAIRQAGPGGGYVLMSSNSIHSSVRPENLRAMVETTREFGRYPLDMAALA